MCGKSLLEDFNMELDKESHDQRELAEAADHINDYLQEIPLCRTAHDWLIRNGFEDTSYQNDIFKDLDAGRKNMHQVKEELAKMDNKKTEDGSHQDNKEIAIAVLKEFNEWRRGLGEYAWNEDPSKNKDLEITPKQIGEAIDFAVEFLKTH